MYVRAKTTQSIAQYMKEKQQQMCLYGVIFQNIIDIVYFIYI